MVRLRDLLPSLKRDLRRSEKTIRRRAELDALLEERERLRSIRFEVEKLVREGEKDIDNLIDQERAVFRDYQNLRNRAL